MFIQGHVLVKRRWQPPKKVGRRTIASPTWTLHRETCAYVRRTKTETFPAPVVAYHGTARCTYCDPISGTEGNPDNGND
jgi:hypothetical protein